MDRIYPPVVEKTFFLLTLDTLWQNKYSYAKFFVDFSLGTYGKDGKAR